MKVFLSWSGDQSRQVAAVLRDWLPCVINAVSPWMSTTDIDRGSRWSSEISDRLDESTVGIICLTAENLNAPWILFEAGALSKRAAESKVCTYLFGIRPSDVTGPLAQFQASEANRTDTLHLLRTLNRSLKEDGIPSDRLEKVYELWWPELDKRLREIKSVHNGSKAASRSDRELLEEILSLVRVGDSKILKMHILEDSVRAVRAEKQSNRNAPPEGLEIVVDTTPLLGERGQIERISYVSKWTTSDFLDELFFHLHEAVPANTYNEKWVLRDSVSKEMMPNMGRKWARKNLGKDSDRRPLIEAGITPGMRLEAVPLLA